MLVSPAPVALRTVSALKAGCSTVFPLQASGSSPSRAPTPARASLPAVRSSIPLTPHLISTIRQPMESSRSARGSASASRSRPAVMSPPAAARRPYRSRSIIQHSSSKLGTKKSTQGSVPARIPSQSARPAGESGSTAARSRLVAIPFSFTRRNMDRSSAPPFSQVCRISGG